MTREVQTEYLAKFTRLMVTRFPGYKPPLTEQLAQALHDRVCGYLLDDIKLETLLIPEINIFREKFPELADRVSSIDSLLKSRFNYSIRQAMRKGNGTILDIRRATIPEPMLYRGRKPIKGKYGIEISGERFVYVMMTPYTPKDKLKAGDY